MDSGIAVTKEARMWAMICHLCGLLAYTAIPFASVIGPLVIWMLKKDEYPFVDHQGREAINFQISILIYLVVCILLVFLFIGIPLLILLGLFHITCTIIAAVKVYDGIPYRYPLTIRFL